MGHDIYARSQTQIDQSEAIHAELRIDDYGDGWSERYEKYRARTEVAYLQRSMGDPANKHIYLALDAMDCHAGCSGNGDSRTFSSAQIGEAAQAIMRLDSAAVTELHPEAAKMQDMLVGALSAAFDVDQIEAGGADVDEHYQPEREFLAGILKHLIDSGDRSIVIEFG